jgi:hypothetical protein
MKCKIELLIFFPAAYLPYVGSISAKLSKIIFILLNEITFTPLFLRLFSIFLLPG